MTGGETYGDGTTPVSAETLTAGRTAAAAASWFEVRRRDSGDEYVTVRDGAPAWIMDMVRAAHDDSDMLPDDYRYRWVRDALEAIGEEASPDAFGPVDDWADVGNQWADADSAMPYTHERNAWLSSHASRWGWVDDECGNVDSGASLSDRLGAGIAAERFYVWSIVTREVLYAVESEVVTPTAPPAHCPEATSAEATSAEATQ